MEQYKVAIIGGGPGGYETAFKLNQLGISVVCFEKERLGGVCLNKGCIPTKALVKVADLYSEMRTASEFGLENCEFPVNYEKVYERKNQVVEKLFSGIEFLFKKKNIPCIKKQITKIERVAAELASVPKKHIKYILYSADEICCEVEYVIIATGSEPKELPFLAFDGENVLSSDNILNIQELPKSLTIIGGGVIGCEFACIFSQLGVDVTIVEFLPDLVPTEDEEISKKLLMAMKKMGIKVFTNTSVVATASLPLNISTENNGRDAVATIDLSLSNGKSISAEKVLVSIGRKPVFNIETIGFELNTNHGYIEINDFCQTKEEKVFAIGDVTGKLMLAHTASKQGMFVADFLNHLENNKSMTMRPLDYESIPACIFTNPEIASCGLTEKQARERFAAIEIGKFPYMANGKALASGATNGFVKTIVNSETDEIIGIHIFGHLATELIAQASILINSKSKVSDLKNIVYAHPTISECVLESIISINQK